VLSLFLACFWVLSLGFPKAYAHNTQHSHTLRPASCGSMQHFSALKNGSSVVGTLKQRELALGMPVASGAPGGAALIYERDFFAIRYEISGIHAVDTAGLAAKGVPNYVLQVADLLQRAYGFYTSRGWNPIALENDKYWVELSNLESGYFGYVEPRAKMGDNPRTTVVEKNAYTSRLFLRNSYRDTLYGNPEQALEVTIFHELLHAFHASYDPYEEAWLLEAQATGMEAIALPQWTDNFRYLSAWFLRPHVSFRFSSYEDCPLIGDCEDQGHEYAMWPLIERMWRRDSTLVPAINLASLQQEQVFVKDSREVLDGLLQSSGTQLVDFLLDGMAGAWLRQGGAGPEDLGLDARIWEPGARKWVPDVDTRKAFDGKACRDLNFTQEIQSLGWAVIPIVGDLPACAVELWPSDLRLGRLEQNNGLWERRAWNAQGDTLVSVVGGGAPGAWIVLNTGDSTITKWGLKAQVYDTLGPIPKYKVALEYGGLMALEPMSYRAWDLQGRQLGSGSLAVGQSWNAPPGQVAFVEVQALGRKDVVQLLHME
jgi:hypothetical protein